MSPMDTTEDRALPRTAASRAAASPQQDSANALPSSHVDTQTLRQRLLEARTALSGNAREVANAALLQNLESGWDTSPAGHLARSLGGRQAIVAAFWPIRNEPDLSDLLVRWATAGTYRIALPTVQEPDAPLVFRPWVPKSPMRVGRFSIPEPHTEETCVPDIVLVPTLGYTPRGERIGYGKGFYDRTLTALRAQGHQFASVGIAFSCGRVAPHEHRAAPHDVNLDAIVDDLGWTIPE